MNVKPHIKRWHVEGIHDPAGLASWKCFDPTGSVGWIGWGCSPKVAYESISPWMKLSQPEQYYKPEQKAE